MPAKFIPLQDFLSLQSIKYKLKHLGGLPSSLFPSSSLIHLVKSISVWGRYIPAHRTLPEWGFSSYSPCKTTPGFQILLVTLSPFLCLLLCAQDPLSSILKLFCVLAEAIVLMKVSVGMKMLQAKCILNLTISLSGKQKKVINPRRDLWLHRLWEQFLGTTNTLYMHLWPLKATCWILQSSCCAEVSLYVNTSWLSSFWVSNPHLGIIPE